MSIKIKVIGLDKVMRNLERFPNEIPKYLGDAGAEVANDVILPTEGLQNYPPEYHAPRAFVSAKQRRYFFWALKHGVIEVPYRRGQSPRSERYGTQFYVEQVNTYKTAIGNRASYARLLGGDEQSNYMVAGGWKKLTEVAKEKIPEIVRVFQLWVNKLIKDLKL